MKECVALVFDLLCEAVVGNAKDVLEFVVSRDGDVAAIGFEVDWFRDAKLCRQTFEHHKSSCKPFATPPSSAIVKFSERSSGFPG